MSEQDEAVELINVTESELKEFIDSRVYTDFMDVVDERIEALRDDMESGDGHGVEYLRGALAQLRFVKWFFPATLSAIQERKRGNDEH